MGREPERQGRHRPGSSDHQDARLQLLLLIVASEWAPQGSLLSLRTLGRIEPPAEGSFFLFPAAATASDPRCQNLPDRVGVPRLSCAGLTRASISCRPG